MARVICLSNQKGGVGKTTSCVNLGVGLARHGKKVLLIDCDAQGSLTASLGYRRPDDLPVTLASVMGKLLTDGAVTPEEGILHHAEGVDLLPSGIELSGVEVSLVNAMSRESILRQYIAFVNPLYEYILLDCMPSLGMITLNALAAADSVLIPVQAEYLPVKGLEQLLQTVAKVRRQINPRLSIDGILPTMVDARTSDAKDVIATLHASYGGRLRIFEHSVPLSVRARESSREGKSIFAHDPAGKVAAAYEALVKGVLADETDADQPYAS
jgi:chromosome partitioning protein